MGLVHIPSFEQRAGQAKTGQVADSQDWSEDGLLLTDMHGVYRWVILRQMEMTYSLRSCLELGRYLGYRLRVPAAISVAFDFVFVFGEAVQLYIRFG